MVISSCGIAGIGSIDVCDGDGCVIGGIECAGCVVPSVNWLIDECIGDVGIEGCGISVCWLVSVFVMDDGHAKWNFGVGVCCIGVCCIGV